jgi:flagellar basal-body rod modification protein FlgD
MAISGITGAQKSPTIVDADKIGFAGLTSQDFLKLLIAQLQNQDPTNPMDSDQLLAQVAQMRNLQSGIELESAIKGLTTSQQLSGATSFLGKRVTAVYGDNAQQIEGVVERVQLRDGKAFLTIGDQEVELKNVIAVTA